jgi:hypothetical protein
MLSHEYLYKIGKNSTSLIRLRDYYIPAPDQVVPSPYQVDNTRGDMTTIGAGYRTIKWVWDILALEHMYTLNRLIFLTETDVSAKCYIYTDVGNGWYNNFESAFKTLYCECKRPLLNSQDGQRVVRSAKAYSSVAYNFYVISEV